MKKETIVIKIDRHEARKTNAETIWQLPEGAVLVYTTATRNKTHWEEYWAVPKNSTLRRIRKSNRGNISWETYKATQLEIPRDELEVISILNSTK
jgi:hypothetical protein